MGNFDVAQKFTQKWEGSLSDDAADKGGLTKYGVSIAFLTDFARDITNQKFLRDLGVPLPVTRDTIRHLDIAQACAIFRREFWDSLHLDDLPVQMGALLYDAAVNSGRSRSVKLAQRGYNACVGHGLPLAVDGKLGPLSCAALKANNTKTVRQSIITVRENFYKEIVRSNPSQDVFLKGWLNRCKDLRTYVEGI
ncbi:MAG: hypothetical protein IJU65_03595 [Desulfovibrio sp.]|nr:hypothetical protein [Desulfovibrio sp.]